MLSYLTRRHSLHRYVRLILEELECRHVPSFLGIQITLPFSGILPSLTHSVGAEAAHAPATTITPGTTTTPSALGPISLSFAPMSFAPSAQSNNPTSVPVVFVIVGASQPTLASSESGTASSESGTGALSPSSSSAFQEGVSQGSGGAFVVPNAAPTAAAAGLGLGFQAAQSASSTVLGGTAFGGFELLGNLPSLLGPANVLQGTTNTSFSAAAPVGALSAGSVFGRPYLFADRTEGPAAAFGSTQPAPEDREEPLPENPPTPPDEDWWVSVPQAVDQVLPPGNVLLRKPTDLQASDLMTSPDRLLPVDAQVFDALCNGIPEDDILSDEDVGMPADEEQPEEQSGLHAAVAILSCAIGAYWAPRFRSFRRVASVLPVRDRVM